MIERQFTNNYVVSLQNAINKDGALFEKVLPIQMLMPMRRNIIEIQKVYAAYTNVLKDIASRYDTDVENVGKASAEDADLQDDLQELLDTIVTISIDPIPASVLTQCGEGKYDAITFADLDILNPMLEEMIE